MNLNDREFLREARRQVADANERIAAVTTDLEVRATAQRDGRELMASLRRMVARRERKQAEGELVGAMMRARKLEFAAMEAATA